MDGTVQGVGFRPFVYRTAAELGLDGWVANVDGHVEGEVAGPPRSIAEFAARLRADAPVLGPGPGCPTGRHRTAVGAPSGIPRTAQPART
ncbi:acylphosphatase [Streptomyces sp. L7]